MRTVRLAISPLVLAAGIAVTAGCGSEPALPPEQQVADRAGERWQALVEGRAEQAYAFFSPAYRQAVSADAYRSRLGGAVNWKNATVESVDCAEDVCSVKISLDYQYKSPVGRYENSRTLEEKWILSEGDWWYYEEF